MIAWPSGYPPGLGSEPITGDRARGRQQGLPECGLQADWLWPGQAAGRRRTVTSDRQGSLRQQRRNVLEYLEGALRAYAEGRGAPPLVRTAPQEPPREDGVPATCRLSDHKIAFLAD